jgi:hypothetical protein
MLVVLHLTQIDSRRINRRQFENVDFRSAHNKTHFRVILMISQM